MQERRRASLNGIAGFEEIAALEQAGFARFITGHEGQLRFAFGPLCPEFFNLLVRLSELRLERAPVTEHGGDLLRGTFLARDGKDVTHTLGHGVGNDWTGVGRHADAEATEVVVLVRVVNRAAVALDDAEITLYVADYLNHSIRAINLLTSQVSTLAGNGKAGFADGASEAAAFNQPYNLKNDGHGALIVPDQNNHAIRRVGMNGVVTTLAGSGAAGYADGKGREAKFNNPTGAVVESDGTVLVADRNNHRIRRITPDGTVTTIAGTGEAAFADGPAMKAKFNRPLDVDVSRDGKLVISEENNHRIRAIAP